MSIGPHPLRLRSYNIKCMTEEWDGWNRTVPLLSFPFFSPQLLLSSSVNKAMVELFFGTLWHTQDRPEKNVKRGSIDADTRTTPLHAAWKSHCLADHRFDCWLSGH